MSGRLIVVSNRLPVRLERTPDGFQTMPSVGGLATALEAVRRGTEMLWIGTPGVLVEDPTEQLVISEDLGRELGSVPLFIDGEEFDLYYNGFSNGTIWPLFHYFPQFAHYEDSEWQAYQSVNQQFAEKILTVANEDDLIWVHDYHLMLVPELIRNALPDATIGFFLHIPFPSYEIFRILPWREEILQGLLGADLLGFHTYGYTRHLLSSLVRLLGHEHEFGRVEVGERTIKVDTFPLGVDVERFEQSLDEPEVGDEIERLREQVTDLKVILSVDRLDFTKGIVDRLQAFEQFLLEHSEWQGRVTLISLTVPSRTRVPEYQSLKSQVDELVGRINGRFGGTDWTPILYMYRSIPFHQLVAMYSVADVALVTPLRDGMNLVAKEYLASHPEGSGVLVLSETAGAAAELGEALIVNPHDLEEMVEALYQALQMSEQEQDRRSRVMRARLKRYNTTRWAQDFIHEMEQVGSFRAQRKPRHLSGSRLQTALEEYQAASSRLFLLDYDGTLVPFAATPEGAAPDASVLELLQTLNSDPDTRVVIVSGRDANTLERWLGETGVELVAEHGGTSFDAVTQQWRTSEEAYSEEWKIQLRPIFEVFVDRTPGSMLEEKGAALVWHFRRADPDMGALRAAELTDALEGQIANTPLHILHGHKVVEVKPSGVSKGKAIQPWLIAKPTADFILTAGDDVTDEALFEAVGDQGYTVKVGVPGRSKAQYYVNSPIEMRSLLSAFLMK